MTTDLLRTTERFAAISLDALEVVGDLQTRRDRKYVVAPDHVVELIGGLSSQTRALEIDGVRTFGYRTTYFDTPELASFFAAAHRRRRRWKIRTRVYEPTTTNPATAKLEVKQRTGRGLTVKTAIDYDPTNHDVLTAEAYEFIETSLGATPLPVGLSPTLTTSYHRTTVFDPATSSRATFDSGLVCDGGPLGMVGLDHVVVETKSAGQASELDRALWRSGIRPIRLSKYCTGLAALRPDLPRNKWHRTLATHFAA